MKFFIGLIAFALISTAYSAGTTTKKPVAPPQDPVAAMVNLINTYTGPNLKGLIEDLAKSESGKYSSKVIDDFCAGVCKQLTPTSKISCADFTNAVQTNYKAPTTK